MNETQVVSWIGDWRLWRQQLIIMQTRQVDRGEGRGGGSGHIGRKRKEREPQKSLRNWEEGEMVIIGDFVGLSEGEKGKLNECPQ